MENRIVYSCVVIGGCITGLLIIVISGVGFYVLPFIVKEQVIEKVRLVNGTDVFKVWEEPVMPIYLQIYIWNTTNPEEVKAGHKPNMTQVGPYTYREHWRKVDIQENSNGTLTYKQIKTYHFEPDKSIGLDSDNFTSINIPLVSYGYALKNESSFTQISANLLAVFFKESLFITRSVNETIWGYKDALLEFVAKQDPVKYTKDVVGILMDKNDTDDGIYTIFNGVDDINQVGMIDRYNGKQANNYWTSDLANEITGSDGSIFPPFLTEENSLHMYATDLCRSLYVNFKREVRGKLDIKLFRYSTPKELFLEPSLNPDNEGFCETADNCLKSGALNISSCQIVNGNPLPIIMSNPHFCQADEEYINGVNGMEPDPEQHTTTLDVEPTSGILMRANKRLQINLWVEPLSYLTEMNNVREMIIPIIWINESMIIDDDNAKMIKTQLIRNVMIANYCIYALLSLGISILLVASLGTMPVIYKKICQEPVGDDEIHLQTFNRRGTFY